MEVHFKEGQEVRRGDLLFTLDQRPLQASVRQMEANVAKDRAGLRQMEATVAQKQAEVSQAEANVAVIFGGEDTLQMRIALTAAFGWQRAALLVAVTAAVLIYLFMAKSIANFSRNDPPPDPSEVELEDVDYRYRCIVCNAQVVLFAAPGGEDPAAPRHCREPMVLVTPVE